MAVTALERMVTIPFMLLFGTATVVLSKFLFEMKSKGKKFEKPWFQVNMMFLGMGLCLVLYFVRKLASAMKGERLLTGEEVEEEKRGHWKNYIKIIPPAMCDLCATGLMYIGLLFVPASIFQIMRGAMVIFSAIMSVIFLKKKLYAFNWLGIGVVIMALVMVGVACVESQSGGASQRDQIVGIMLIVGAQLIQATQIVVEEFLLKNVKAPPLLIVGTEGMWGLLVTTLIVLPLVSLIPGTGGEDTMDTLDMLAANHDLIYVTMAYVVAILVYNLFGMMVTQQFSAVHRTILEAMRTLCIWITDLIIYYGFTKDHGEEWTVWSYLELAGFGLLVFGTFVYNRVLELPFLTYPPPAAKK